MESALRPLYPTPPNRTRHEPDILLNVEAQTSFQLDQSGQAKHHHSDPRKHTSGGRHQIGTPAGFKSESVAGFLLECVAGFVGIRRRIENCQIGVFLGYASPRGHALIDRRLYLPKDWIEDGERRKAAGIPDDLAFATKPKIGIAMVEAALDAGVPCAWVLGDTVYGSDKTLRVMLERHDKPYVLSIRGNERLIMGDFRTHTAEDLAAGLAMDQWRRLPAGQGSKGPRLYDWARLRLFRLQSPPWDHWLLIRRSISDPTDMAFYVTFGPHETELKELAAVAGLRWTIEECFQSAKGETGLDHCEARSWHGWHRHMTLSMLALAFLAGLRARLKEAQISVAAGKANKRSLSAAA